jgi:hypothetical protein
MSPPLRASEPNGSDSAQLRFSTAQIHRGLITGVRAGVDPSSKTMPIS